MHPAGLGVAGAGSGAVAGEAGPLLHGGKGHTSGEALAVVPVRGKNHSSCLMLLSPWAFGSMHLSLQMIAIVLQSPNSLPT